MRKRVSFIEEVEGVDCELTHEPCEWQEHGVLTQCDKQVELL